MNRPVHLLLIALLGSLLAACGTAPPAPADRFYRLPAPPAAAGGRLADGVLRVRPIRAEGVHAERAILYTAGTQSLHLEQERYAFWVESPQRLVQQYTLDWLRGRGAADMVVDETVREADYELRGRILAFERVGDSAIALGLELRLDNAWGKPLLIESYRREVQMDGRGNSAAARAFGQALDAILQDFADDAREALAAVQ